MGLGYRGTAANDANRRSLSLTLHQTPRRLIIAGHLASFHPTLPPPGEQRTLKGLVRVAGCFAAHHCAT